MRDRLPRTMLTTFAALLLSAGPALADTGFGGMDTRNAHAVGHTVQEGFDTDPKPDPTGSISGESEPFGEGGSAWGGSVFDPPDTPVRLGAHAATVASVRVDFDDAVVGGLDLSASGGFGAAGAIPGPGALSLLGLAAWVSGHRRRRRD